MEALLILLGCVAAFLISTVVTKKVSNKIYIITGYHGFGDMQRMLCCSILIILFVIYIIFPDNYSLGLLSLVPVAALIFLNLKAKKPVYIISLTLLQLFYGIIWFVIFLIKIVLKFFLKMDFNALSFEAVKPLKDATLERAEWCAKNKGYADVAAWVASESSYGNVDAAYEGGFFNGKLY